jgi:hypothetical protein
MFLIDVHNRVRLYLKKTVSCFFQDGQTRCQKQQCQKLTCRYHIKEKEECCPRCAQNSAEVKLTVVVVVIAVNVIVVAVVVG